MALDVIRGVNLGGWLLTEQWITPSLYGGVAADEWHLCSVLGKKDALSTLEDHWSSFYVQSDIEDIAAAGLNSLRIPIGYWAVSVEDYEPYVSGQYPYLIQAVQWAQELNMTVLIDLHGVPGSQNGQDNSGLIGPVLFQTNSTNSDRAVAVLRNLTEEFGREEYGGIVSIEVLNEPRVSETGLTMGELKGYYSEATQAVREMDGTIGVAIHDAFWGPSYWSDYNPLTNSSSSSSPSFLTIDTHQYYAFAPLNNLPHDTILQSICNVSQLLKQTDAGLPNTLVGEWSLETGHAPNSTSSSQNRGDTQEKRTWLRLMFEAQLAAYTPNGAGQPIKGFYYWCWKTEYQIDTWSYSFGLSLGYIPADVSNASTLAFPVFDYGCVDTGYNYTAPRTARPSSAIRRMGVWSSAWMMGALLGVGLGLS